MLTCFQFAHSWGNLDAIVLNMWRLRCVYWPLPARLVINIDGRRTSSSFLTLRWSLTRDNDIVSLIWFVVISVGLPYRFVSVAATTATPNLAAYAM